MNPRFGQHGDGGDFHFDIRYVGNRWEWEVIQRNRGRIASGFAASLDAAKAAAITAVGRGPDQWRDIGPAIMTTEEHTIAEAAIATPPASNHVQLDFDIASALRMDAVIVKESLARLVEEGYLKVRGGPVANLAAGDPLAPLARIWYEQDREWPR